MGIFIGNQRFIPGIHQRVHDLETIVIEEYLLFIIIHVTIMFLLVREKNSAFFKFLLFEITGLNIILFFE